MAKFYITVEDEDVQWIAAAREAYNAELPETVPSEDGERMVPNPALIATDLAYIQHVMTGAVSSYKAQYHKP